jgi:hypothetical protein
MEPISAKWKNNKVSDMQEKHASQGKANIKPEGDDNEGRCNSSVTGIPNQKTAIKIVIVKLTRKKY